MHKNSLIYIIEDDPDFGKLLYVRLRREKFNNVVLYLDENECLKDIKSHPKILIVDYH